MTYERALEKLVDANDQIAAMKAALQSIVEQVAIAEDPEHHTLSLVGKIAEQALTK